MFAFVCHSDPVFVLVLYPRVNAFHARSPMAVLVAFSLSPFGGLRFVPSCLLRKADENGGHQGLCPALSFCPLSCPFSLCAFCSVCASWTLRGAAPGAPLRRCRRGCFLQTRLRRFLLWFPLPCCLSTVTPREAPDAGPPARRRRSVGGEGRLGVWGQPVTRVLSEVRAAAPCRLATRGPALLLPARVLPAPPALGVRGLQTVLMFYFL